MHLRQRIWEIVEVAKAGDRASHIFDIALVSLIFLNVVAAIIGSVQSIEERYSTFLSLFETVSVLVFTTEYLARLWSCTADPRFPGLIRGRVRLALQFMPLIDLLAILPFYLPFLGVDLRALRVLRLLRIVRIAKLGRYSSSLQIIKQVFQTKKEELVLTSGLMVFLLVMSASLLYYCENAAQPEAFSSIPATMWWAIATLTTVGYGDMYPVTLMGKFLASVVALLGIGMFALPAGILGSGFVETVQKQKESKPACPHCGKPLN